MWLLQSGLKRKALMAEIRMQGQRITERYDDQTRIVGQYRWLNFVKNGWKNRLRSEALAKFALALYNHQIMNKTNFVEEDKIYLLTSFECSTLDLALCLGAGFGR